MNDLIRDDFERRMKAEGHCVTGLTRLESGVYMSPAVHKAWAAEKRKYARDGYASWSIFNGAGALVADNQTAQDARDWLTDDRSLRGWTAVYCRVAKSADDVRAA